MDSEMDTNFLNQFSCKYSIFSCYLLLNDLDYLTAMVTTDKDDLIKVNN